MRMRRFHYRGEIAKTSQKRSVALDRHGFRKLVLANYRVDRKKDHGTDSRRLRTYFAFAFFLFLGGEVCLPAACLLPGVRSSFVLKPLFSSSG